MTISKRNGKYYCRFQIDGERHHYLCAGAKDEKQALKIEQGFMYKVQQQQNGVIPRNKTRIKLNILYAELLKYSQLNKKSWKHDVCRLKLIKECWKNKKYTDEIKPDDVEDLKIFLLDRDLSKQTVNRYVELVSKMFSIGIENELVIKNPAKGKKFKTKHYQLNILHDGDEQERLFAVLPDYFYGIVLIALNSGLRKGNIQFLQGKNIHLKSRMFEFTENKGNKHIKLPMTEKVYEYLSRINFKDDDYIFKRPNGKLWTNTAFHKEWHDILKKAGIEKLRFHDLRHTVGTRLAKDNVPVPVIQKIFAHSNIQTTMQYIQTAEREVQRAMEVLNSYN